MKRPYRITGKRRLVFNCEDGLLHGWHMRRGEFTVEPALVEARYVGMIETSLRIREYRRNYRLEGADQTLEEILTFAGEHALTCSLYSWRAGNEPGIKWYTAPQIVAAPEAPVLMRRLYAA